MWLSDSTTRRRQRGWTRDLAGLFLAGVLLIALTACSSQRASTRSGVAALVSSSGAPVSSSAPGSDGSAYMSCYATSGPRPTTYAGAAMAPDMTALLEWTRAGSTATGTIELSGHPEAITLVGPGTYPLCISFVNESFSGNVEVKGQLVAISGQLTAAGVDVTFNASTYMYPTLSFTSIGPSAYSYPPSYPAG
jgi:hypothetical protein